MQLVQIGLTKEHAEYLRLRAKDKQNSQVSQQKEKRRMAQFGAPGQNSRATSDFKWKNNELWLECS